MLHGVLRLTCRPLPGSWCFSIWSIPALWVQRGEPAVLSSLWAVQTFVHQLQPAKESQRHLHNLYPARSPPGGTHVHTQSYWLHWAACLLGTGIVIQVLFIFSSFCIANCCTAQSLCVIKKLVWVVQIWRYSVPSIAAFMWSWFFFFLPLIETFPHSMRLCVTVAELKGPNTVEEKKNSFASLVGPLFPRSPAPLSYTAAIARCTVGKLQK